MGAHETRKGVRIRNRVGQVGQVVIVRPTTAHVLYGVQFDNGGFEFFLHQEVHDPNLFEILSPEVPHGGQGHFA